MINELKEIIPLVPELLKTPTKWQSLLINKHPPVIHRISYKLSTDRVILLHKLFNTKNARAFMHSHSQNFACKLLDGEYEMGVGFSTNRNSPPENSFTCFVKTGNVYEMSSPNVWHYTKPLKHIEYIYSILLLGKRIRERKSENNSELSDFDKKSLIVWFETHQNYFNNEI